ncbi:MAG: phosphatase PAP2 family protein [Eubacteriales bacterium]|nr:phosphatase PAP2 family protein [Eubacteriales bacterium]
MKVRDFLKKYNHALVFLYAFIYMPWFMYLEKHVTKHFYLIHSPLDDYIPFVEYFIVPYLLWFLFIAAGALYLFFTDKKGFLQMAAFLIAGMTIFLIICTVFPNGLNLRPTTFPRDNIFTDLVRYVYSTDTPTNVLPSMHVFNSLGLCIGLNRTESLKNKKWIRFGIYLLTVLIILSTVFLKQHSVTDMIAGLALGAVLYQIVYVHERKRAKSFLHQPVI